MAADITIFHADKPWELFNRVLGTDEFRHIHLCLLRFQPGDCLMPAF